MIRLNLLPFRAARKKENVRRQVSIILLSLILISVVMVAVFISFTRQINNLNALIKEKKAEVEKYDQINKKIAQIKKQLNILQKKKEVIDSLELNRKEPVRLMDAMTKLIIARRMYFDSFSSKGNTVKVSGVALDNQTVADFMARLQKSKLFKSVRLGPIREKKVKQANLKSFQITCQKVSAATDESTTSKKVKKRKRKGRK